MAPLCTALTIVALRRGTQRFVSVGGKSSTVVLIPDNLFMAYRSPIEAPRTSRMVERVPPFYAGVTVRFHRICFECGPVSGRDSAVGRVSAGSRTARGALRA